MICAKLRLTSDRQKIKCVWARMRPICKFQIHAVFLPLTKYHIASCFVWRGALFQLLTLREFDIVSYGFIFFPIQHPFNDCEVWGLVSILLQVVWGLCLWFSVLVVTPANLHLELLFCVTLCIIKCGPVSMKYIFTTLYNLAFDVGFIFYVTCISI